MSWGVYSFYYHNYYCSRWCQRSVAKLLSFATVNIEVTTTFRGKAGSAGSAGMHSPPGSFKLPPSASDQATQMTLWHSNGHVTRQPGRALLPPRRGWGWGRANSRRLCFVGQLMNHLMENAIPDFRFVCVHGLLWAWGLCPHWFPYLALSIDFKLLPHLRLGHWLFIGHTQCVLSWLVYLAADKPLSPNYFNTRRMTMSF